jgi:hypothetical protein
MYLPSTYIEAVDLAEGLVLNNSDPQLIELVLAVDAAAADTQFTTELITRLTAALAENACNASRALTTDTKD